MSRNEYSNFAKKISSTETCCTQLGIERKMTENRNEGKSCKITVCPKSCSTFGGYHTFSGCYRGAAIGGKTGKIAVLPGFCKIVRRSCWWRPFDRGSFGPLENLSSAWFSLYERKQSTITKPFQANSSWDQLKDLPFIKWKTLFQSSRFVLSSFILKVFASFSGKARDITMFLLTVLVLRAKNLQKSPNRYRHLKLSFATYT